MLSKESSSALGEILKRVMATEFPVYCTHSLANEGGDAGVCCRDVALFTLPSHVEPLRKLFGDESAKGATVAALPAPTGSNSQDLGELLLRNDHALVIVLDPRWMPLNPSTGEVNDRLLTSVHELMDTAVNAERQILFTQLSCPLRIRADLGSLTVKMYEELDPTYWMKVRAASDICTMAFGTDYDL